MTDRCKHPQAAVLFLADKRGPYRRCTWCKATQRQVQRAPGLVEWTRWTPPPQRTVQRKAIQVPYTTDRLARWTQAARGRPLGDFTAEALDFYASAVLAGRAGALP